MRILILTKNYSNFLNIKEVLEPMNEVSVYFEPVSEDKPEIYKELMEFIPRQNIAIVLVSYNLWGSTMALDYVSILNFFKIPFITFCNRHQNTELVSVGAYYSICTDDVYALKLDKKKFEFEMRKAITLQKNKKD